MDDESSGAIAENTRAHNFAFLKGGVSSLKPKNGKSADWDSIIYSVREQLSEAMNARHVAFLFGSGTSSFVKDGKELGIPTMAPLAREFTATVGTEEGTMFPTVDEREILKDHCGLDFQAQEYAANLERLMEVLNCLRFALSRSARKEHLKPLEAITSVIRKIQRFILARCTDGEFATDGSVQSLYESFYRKLMLRDRSLPRPWVFTTNYDLFNEIAMDRLGVHYCNGFSGAIERRFNPAVFRYTLAEQLDVTSRKWSAVDGFLYLCKLHGSVSWTEDGHGLFPIREKQDPNSAGTVMIFPTPAKQNSSLGSPYADLFREFQSRVVQEQSVLFVVGYSFGDEHVNNIIYQALTIPTFRLIIFADPNASGDIKKLRGLKDPRIWIIGGDAPDGRRAHYFESFVNDLMPSRPGDRVDIAIRNVLEELIQPQREANMEATP